MAEQKETLSGEEEGKESSPERPSCSAVLTPTVLDSDMARAGIPEEIENKRYTSERELCMDLEKFGLDDRRHIILNKDGFAIWREMPGSEHNSAVHEIMICFDEWKNGRSIKGTTLISVYVNDSFNRPRNESRRLHFAIYGPDRLEGRRFRIVNWDFMNPHVIFLFSWTNNAAEEKCAVDDLMHYAGIGDYIHLGRPNSTYLIKALRRGSKPESPVYGFDVFQVEQDQFTSEEPTMKYRCGGQEDTVISISPASMGLAGDEGEPFTIALSQIRESVERLKITFVPALGHEM